MEDRTLNKYELKTWNVQIIKSERYFRVEIIYDTHHLHSEKLNLASAIKLRDQLLGVSD